MSLLVKRRLPQDFLKSCLSIIAFLCLACISQQGKILGPSPSFYTEHCGIQSSNPGTNTVTCTFSTPQSDILNHQVALAQLSKPTGLDIEFSVVANYFPGSVPYPSYVINTYVGTSAILKLGYFVVLIKSQPASPYIDVVTISIGSGSVLEDPVLTGRTFSEDKDISMLTVFWAVNANTLTIIPFVTCFKLTLDPLLTNDPLNEYSFAFRFYHQIASPTTIKLKVAVSNTVLMKGFSGFILLVNHQLILSQKTAHQSNPALPATDVLSAHYSMGNPSLGKIGAALFDLAFSTFGTSYNTKCLLGFDSLSYTRNTHFTYEMGKNSLGNFNRLRQPEPMTLFPQMQANFFCYGMGWHCSDLTPYYDQIEGECYTGATCPLPEPAGWPHVGVCPWCEQLICSSCNVSNRSQCITCSPGSFTSLNPTTKRCECIAGYYEVTSSINPVTWNGQNQTLYLCKFNCTVAFVGCETDLCTATECTTCQDGFLRKFNAFGNGYCQPCSDIRPNCAKCSSNAYCDQCMYGFYLQNINSVSSPYPVIGRQCRPCLLHCKTCFSSSQCDTCFSGYLLDPSKTTCTCDVTLSNLFNCHSCTINTTCDNCFTGFFISSVDGTCHPCTEIDGECATCVDQNTCDDCNAGFGVETDGAKVVCGVCDSLVEYCDVCEDVTSCQHCRAPYGVENPGKCQYCEVLKGAGCIECLNAVDPCTKCTQVSFLINGACYFCSEQIAHCSSCQINPLLQILQCLSCSPGYYLHLDPTTSQKECLPCPAAITNCLECTTATFCTLCQYPNKLNPTTNLCTQCQFPFVNYENGLCMKEAGCMNALQTLPLGNMTCLACRNYLHYVYDPDSRSCVCAQGYVETIAAEPQKRCETVCGDGMVVVLNEQCDDGNHANFDGCSSTCRIEQHFRCTEESPSKCVLYRDFELFEFLFARRVPHENKGVLFFRIDPMEVGLSTMDWARIITINFSNQDSVKASSFQYRYSIETGYLQIEFQYSETVEGSTLQYDITFDPSTIVSSPSSFRSTITKVQGINAPLILQPSQLLSISRTIQLISFILGILSIIQFYIGSYMGKMIGLQTIQILQTVYFCRMGMSPHPSSSIFHSLNPLKLSTSGYSASSALFDTPTLAQNNFLPPQFTHIEMERYFICNVNVWVLVILFTIAVCLVVSVRKSWERRKVVEGKETGVMYKFVETRRSVKYIYEQLIFTQVMMVGLMLYFSNLVGLKPEENPPAQTALSNKTQPSPFSTTNLALSAFFTLSTITLFTHETTHSLTQFLTTKLKLTPLLSPDEKLQLDENSPHRPNYHPLYIFVYLAYYSVLSLVMSLNSLVEGFVYGLEVGLVVGCGYFIGVWCWGPYDRAVSVHNSVLKLNHGVAVFCLASFVVINRVQDINSIACVVLTCIILALLFLVLVGGFFRVYIEHQYRKKLNYQIKSYQNTNANLLEDKMLMKMNKIQRKESMLQNNKFILKNQLQDLKQAYFKNQGRSLDSKTLTGEEEEFFIKKIKQEMKEKVFLYDDFWGKEKKDGGLNGAGDQLVKPSDKTEDSKNIVESNKLESKDSQSPEPLTAQKEQTQRNKSKKQKHSNKQKQILKRLKTQLRSELNQMDSSDPPF